MKKSNNETLLFSDEDILDGTKFECLIEQLDVKIRFVCTDIGATVITHHFNLFRIGDFKKVKTSIESISAFVGCNCKMIASEKGHFALEVSRKDRVYPTLSEYEKSIKKNSIIFGVDQEGNALELELGQLPHCLVAGQTGSGKSACLNTIITQLIVGNKPSEMKLFLIDGKGCELSKYNEAKSYLYGDRVFNGDEFLETKLAELCQEMEKRYNYMKQKNIQLYDKGSIVLIIDELADLIDGGNYFITVSLKRLTAMGRAAKIHVIIATQRPVVKVVDGNILSNLPTRVALTTTTSRESIIILGHKGAEVLSGKGDALVKTNIYPNDVHIQVLYTDNEYIDKKLKELK